MAAKRVERMLEKVTLMLSDVVTVLGSMNIIAAELDC